MTPRLHLGKYFRFLDETSNLLVVQGDFQEVAVSRRLYDERYKIAPTPAPADALLTPLMGAAALAAVSLADRESWGWTLTIGGSDLGFFVGVEPEGMICGRVQPAEPAKNAAYVQRQKGEEPMTQSYFEPVGERPADAVTRYFEQAVQVKTRIALDDTGSGILVQALPNGVFGAVDEMDDPAFLRHYRECITNQTNQTLKNETLKPVGEVLIFYECRCDDEMVLNMITSLPDAQRQEVWGDQTCLDIECPRCARGYQIERPLH